MMVIEEMGGASLESHLRRRRLPWQDVLRLAVHLTRAIDQIHQTGMVHQNLQPAHILWNPDTDDVRLGGFELASSVPEQLRGGLQGLSIITGEAGGESSLQYLSPEQTGRMNRVVDSRTDLYSLGATLYAALTGGPPFSSEDPMEMVHSIIARTPQPPHERNPETPHLLSDIVMRLLEKNPEDRYQSAFGLERDLDRCLTMAQEGKRLDPFDLGREDVSPILRIPHTLYGREEHKDRLQRALDRAGEGWSGLFLIAGNTGVGKTALVREIQRPVTDRRGYFVEGKFDQYQHAPYRAWIPALSALADQLLTEPSSRLEPLRAQLERASEGNGRVLTEIVPALERVLGPQPPVPALDTAQAQNRFNRVFQAFIRTIASDEHPLVVFLDDLQWTDSASLGLIQALLTDPSLHHFLLVGTYRDNEVNALHPLSLTVEELTRQNAPLERETLQPLSKDDVHALVSNALRRPWVETAPLAEVIYAKAGGNPFFTHQILHTLENERLVRFDHPQRRWEWNLEAIRAHGITDNVVAMLSKRFRHLPRPTQRLLQHAACMGSHFELGSVSLVAEITQEEARRDLLPAMEQDLLIPSGNELVFAHDRVQQAAYSIIPEEERPAIHWKIGEQLLRGVPPAEREARLFDIVNQLNLGARLNLTRAEAQRLADLNLQAGRRATTRSAFRAALDYFEHGIRYLSEEGWDDAYPVTLALHHEAISAAQICGQSDRMYELGAFARRHAQSILDQIPIEESEIKALGQFMPALRQGLQVLDRLGLHLSEEPDEEVSRRQLEQVLALLNQVTVEGVLDLPEMTSPAQLAQMSILSQIFESAYTAGSGLLVSWASTMAEICLRHGNCFHSPLAFATFAWALCDSDVHVNAGYQLAKAALRLMEQRHAEVLKSRVLALFGGTIQHRMEPLRNSITTFKESITIGAATGDFAVAAVGAFNLSIYAFLAGEPLKELEQRIDQYLEIITSLRQAYWWNALTIWKQATRRLWDYDDHSKSQDLDEAQWLSVARAANDPHGTASYFLVKLITAYLLGEKETERYSTGVRDNLAGLKYSFKVAVFYFYDSLALLKRNPSAGRGPRVRANQSRLLALARFAPMNLQHKYDLVEAEIAQAEGRDWQAAQLYEKAIDGALRNDFIQEEALACEQTGLFYLSRGMEQTGRLLLTRARDRFAAWQATAKVRQLNEFLGSTAAIPAKETDSALDARLDVRSIMKAAQAIASEIELEKLLVTLVAISMENAGARFGALVLEKDGRWVVRVHKSVEGPDMPSLQPIPLERCDRVSAGIVRYVARSNQPVILADAAGERLFAHDPHVQQHRCKSVLCMPVTSLGKPLGVLYLENDRATGAFSQNRLQVLEMLVSHAVTSLENAQAYRALRDSETKYRQIVDTAFEGIWVLGPDTLTIFVNARMAQMLGYSRKEMTGRPVTDFMLEQDAPDHHRKMENRRQGLSEVYERVFCHRDGHVVWTLASATPSIDQDGRFQGSFAMFTDITERKQAEELLRRLNRELRAISLCNQVLIRAGNETTLTREICQIICDVAGYQLAWVGYLANPNENAANQNAITLRPSACAGVKSELFAHLDLTLGKETEPESVGAAVKTGETVFVQNMVADQALTRWRPRLEEHGLRSGLALPLKDESDQVFGVLLIGSKETQVLSLDEIRLMEELARDLAYGIVAVRTGLERKKAEKAVRESERRLTLLVQNAPVGIVIHASDGRVLRWNPAARELLGLSEQEMKDRPSDQTSWRFFREDGTGMPQEEYLVNRAIVERQPVRNAVVGLLKPGVDQITWGLVNAVPLFDQERHLIEVIVMFMDITERKHIEEELKEAARRKDDFIAMLGHELRNPLAPIQNASYILKLLGSPDSRANRAQEMIERQVVHLGRIVDDLLDVSRIARGKITLQMKQVDFVQLVRTAVEDLQDEMEAHEIWLSLHLPDENVLVEGDSARLSQMVNNLLLNAIKFTDRSGRIDVEIRAPISENTFVTLEVQDTGIGMTPQTLARLFSPFEQADTGIARSRGGLGLGLALVKGIVTLHGGTVQAASEGLGKGSRFTLQLPAVAVKRASRSYPPGTSKAKELSILVVEDNVDAAKSLQLLLEIMGHSVKVAPDGVAAVAAARAFKPDVIICDIGLPGMMDGYAVAQAIRADPSLRSARLVALTGYGQEKDIQLAREAGFDVHMTKPANAGMIQQFLQRT
jgi:PAS domain S-box-containing protein